MKAEVVDATKLVKSIFSGSPEVIAEFADILKVRLLQSL